MKFKDAYEKLDEGSPIRRTGSRYKWIRKVDPRTEPDIDGPSRVFVIASEDGRYMSNQGEFDSEKDAKAALKQLRTSLTKEHKEFAEVDAKWNEASEADREAGTVKPGTSPALRASFYDGAYVKERPANRSNRITSPYLIGRTEEGSVEVVTLSGSDLFATNWSIA